MPSQLSSIPFESPPSARRSDASYPVVGGPLPYYIVGKESSSLSYLFDDTQLKTLETQSPIVFYGPPATGKTSLAITLATRWARLFNAKPLVFATGQSFAADYVEALEADDVEHFRRKMRRCRLLVIDGVDALDGKGAAQEELMNTIDSLVDADKPIIATLNRLPTTCRGLRTGLASRLSAGLTIPLVLPDTEVQTRFLHDFFSASEGNVDPEPIVQLLQKSNATLPIPQLGQLASYALQQRKSTGGFEINLVKEFLSVLLKHDPPDLPTIAKAAARRFSVKLSELRGSTRAAKVVRARGLAIVLARRLTGSSLQQIGEYFGGRDHSTILHSVRKIEESLIDDAELAVALHDMEVELNSAARS